VGGNILVCEWFAYFCLNHWGVFNVSEWLALEQFPVQLKRVRHAVGGLEYGDLPRSHIYLWKFSTSEPNRAQLIFLSHHENLNKKCPSKFLLLIIVK